ncbi:hypothetical protein Emag_001947 [Eimeria magna]
MQSLGKGKAAKEMETQRMTSSVALRGLDRHSAAAMPLVRPLLQQSASSRWAATHPLGPQTQRAAASLARHTSSTPARCCKGVSHKRSNSSSSSSRSSSNSGRRQAFRAARTPAPERKAMTRQPHQGSGNTSVSSNSSSTTIPRSSGRSTKKDCTSNESTTNLAAAVQLTVEARPPRLYEQEDFQRQL